jgi:hypothetical protein
MPSKIDNNPLPVFLFLLVIGDQEERLLRLNLNDFVLGLATYLYI